MAGVTITLFLPNGNSRSLRIAEISNWNGKTLAAPRTDLADLLKREELEKPGVYLLLGTDPDTGRPAAYIGEAEIVRERLKQHGSKEFWVQAVVFVSQGENLTKSHIKYLEGCIIEEAKRTGRAMITNNQSSSAKLPESARADMEVFLDRIRQLLPIMGCDLLVPLVEPAGRKTESALICKFKSLQARGQRSAQGFVVFKGSHAVATLRPSAKSWAGWLVNLRDKLLKDQILAATDGKLVFQKDYEFASPSAAAAVIHGGPANGLSAWRTKSGKMLKELDAAG